MAGKYGKGSGIFLVDGYDLAAQKVTDSRFKVVSPQKRTDGIADLWDENSPLGVIFMELQADGMLWQTDTVDSHAALNTEVPGAGPQTTARVVCLGFAGQTVGVPCHGFEGAFHLDYEVVMTREDLSRASSLYQLTGQYDAGVVLQEVESKTADWNTESESVDNSASSANGGVGYLHVTELTTFTNLVVKIQDSADDAAWADLITFTDNVTDPFAERLTVAGTVDRYLSIDGNVTGSGTVSVFVMFSRS